MKKEFLKFPAVVVLMLAFVLACTTELVDEDPLGPTEETFFNNAAEFRQILVGVYAGYYDWFFGFGTDGSHYSMQRIPGDDLTESQGARTSEELFDGSLNSTSGRVGTLYNTCYQVITRANVVLDKISQVEDFSELEGGDEVVGMEGEALFLRSFAYFTLFNNFGDVPLILQRPPALTDVNVPKSPANDIITQVIEDCKRAIEILPTSWDDGNRGRVTKNSARGLLMKALVFRANYNGDDAADLQEAITAFNSLTSVLLPNFIDNFDSDRNNNAESVFEIQSAKPGAFNNIWLDNDGPWRGVESLHVYRGYMMEPGVPNNDGQTKFLITDKLLNAYGTDPRISVFLNPSLGATESKIFQKYNKPDGTNILFDFVNTSSNNERLLRHADFVLLAAEAYLKTGNTQGAVDLVNSVRTRARTWGADSGFGDGVTPADYPSSGDATQIMQWIMNERWVELAGEAKRWDDLRRWHRSGDMNLSSWTGDDAGFSTFLSSPVQFDVSKHLLYPIPQDEIDRNSAISENNPGY